MGSLKFEKEIVSLKIESILPNKYQPRKQFDKDNLYSLAKSIKENGILQPITVRVCDGKFELVAGERRLKACKLIGLTYIPTIIVNSSDEDSAMLSFIENIQKCDLNYFDEAECYVKLMKQQNLTVQELAEKVGLSKNILFEKLRLLTLKDKIKNFLITNNLTEQYGKVILKVDDEKKQLELLEIALFKNMSFYEFDKLVENFNENFSIHRNFRDISLLTDTLDEAMEFLNEGREIANYKVDKVGEKYTIVIDVNLSC
ncbi:MAG: ParB/RepB/Spo0J family partition protein [Lachnospirales bacterium]